MKSFFCACVHVRMTEAAGQNETKAAVYQTSLIKRQARSKRTKCFIDMDKAKNTQICRSGEKGNIFFLKVI